MKGDEMKPPCKGCILIPLCKHKPYSILFNHCDILRDYIPNSLIRGSRNQIRVDKIQVILKPSKWYMRKDGYIHIRETYRQGTYTMRDIGIIADIVV